jgi:hypothetical protein
MCGLVDLPEQYRASQQRISKPSHATAQANGRKPAGHGEAHSSTGERHAPARLTHSPLPGDSLDVLGLFCYAMQSVVLWLGTEIWAFIGA